MDAVKARGVEKKRPRDLRASFLTRRSGREGNGKKKGEEKGKKERKEKEKEAQE